MKEQLLSRLKEIQTDSFKVVPNLKSSQEIQDFKVSVLGRNGKLKAVLNQLGALNQDDRPVVGQVANRIKQEIESKLDSLQKLLANSSTTGRGIDITLPGLKPPTRRAHPI